MRRVLSCLLGAVLVARPYTARADETPAERLFREGRALMIAGRFDEACPKFARSQELDPHTGTLLNLATCHEGQGRVATAWVEYQKTLTAARVEGQAARVRLAEERLAILEPRVPWLRIAAPARPSTVTLDGSELAPASLGTELPVDPGWHIVRAESVGATAGEDRFELHEGEHRSVTVEPLGPPRAPERVVVEPVSDAGGGAPNVDNASKADSSPRRKGRWILEPGVFAAYLFGKVSEPSIYHGDDFVRLLPTTGSELGASCAGRGCTLGEISEADGSTGGANVFAGYALSDTMDVGLRFVAGPEIGPAGASIVAVGPSITVHPNNRVGLGLWGMYADATLKGKALALPPAGYRVAGNALVHSKGDLGGGFGAGLELSVRVIDLGRGGVVVNSTPFVIVGVKGTAICVPLGVGYRFE